MSHIPSLRSAAPSGAPRRAFALASGAALLAVVAPGLAQAQSDVFPILPAAPTMTGTTMTGTMSNSARVAANNPAPVANKKLVVTPFTPPQQRTIRVSKRNAADAYPFVNRAAKALKAGNTVGALSLYQRAYQLDPTNPYAAPGVGTAQIVQGQFAAAAQTFRNYLATRPADRKDLRTAASRKSADDQYRAALRGLADALTYSKQYSRAAGVNNYILSLASKDLSSLYQNGLIASYAGDYQTSENYFRRFLALAPNNRKALRGLADTLTYSRKYSEATRINNKILAADSRDYDALYQNALIATYARNYEASDPFFNRAANVKDSDPDLWLNWGKSLAYRSKPDSRAVAKFDRALALRPGNVAATQGKADYYAYSKQFDRAIEPLTTILQSDPKNFKALVSLGDALSYIDQPANAIAYYQRALALKPSDFNAHLGLGRALVFAKRSAEGEVELKRVLAVAPNNRAALEALAVAQNVVAPGEATRTYETLLGLAKTPAERVKILASIGDLQLGAQDLQASATSYGQAAQLAPNDPEIVLSYAQILGYAGRLSEAEPLVERVLALSPNNPRALALQVQIAAQPQRGPDGKLLPVSARARQLAANLRNFTPRTAQEALAFADALRDAGDPQAANELLQRASSLSNDPAIALRIANGTRDNGSYADSVELYNRLLRANPNDKEARTELARALYYASNVTEANNQLDQVFQLDPNYGPALVLKIDLDTAGGDLGQAERGARSLLSKGPNASASASLGNVLAARGKFADAVEQYQTSLAAQPNNLQAQLGLARNLYYLRRVDDSIDAYQRLIELAPADTLPRLELAQIYLDRNRFNEAEQLFNEVLSLQQRGVAALPAARRASERGELARLNPQSIRGSILKNKPLAKLSAADVSETEALKIVTVALAQVKPKKRVAQSASPTVGIGGEIGSSAPPAASFPSGSIAPTEGAVGAGAPADGATGGDAATPGGAMPMDDGSFIPTAPLPPMGGMRGRQTVPRVPTGAGEINDFSAPLTPGGATLTTVSDQAKAYIGLGEIRLRQGRYAESLQAFRQAIKIDSNATDAHIGVARVLRAQNDYVAAFEEVNKALAIETARKQKGAGPNPPKALTSSPSEIKARILRAQLLADQGQPDQSQAELDALKNDLPEDVPLETLLTLSEALNSLKNYGTSLQILEVASQLYPNEIAPVRLRAETLNFAGRTADSVALYDRLIAADPSDGDAILGKARVYNYSNSLTEAETTYRQVLTVQPSNYQAQIELADVLGRRGNYTDAIQLYALAIQGNPSDLNTRIALARMQRYAGRESDAEATLTQVLDADARNVEALTERGILRGVQGSYAPALADLQQALQIAPRSQTALLGLAEVQGYAGQYEQSIAGYRAVLATDPTNDKARTELGEVLSYSGDDAAALKELDAVLAKNPTNMVALLVKADVLGRSNRTNEAVRIYNSVLVADPRNVRARSGLADTYVTGRRYADAIKIYDQLIAAEPKNSSYKIARARALGYNRQFVPASEALRAVIAAEPDNLAARLAFAEVGTNSGNRGLRNGAIAEYRRLVAANPTNVPARVGLARALSYQGQTREAATTLQTVLAAEPNNVPARVALGDAQRFGGKPFDARESYKTALKTDPGNVGAQAGLDATRKATSPSVGVSGSYYNDTNGVRLKSVNYNGALRTRGGVIGVIAEQGRFQQGPFRTNRSNIGLTYGKNFGPLQATAAVSRLKYGGVSEKFLYDLSLVNSSVERRRYFLATGRRDIYESAQAVAQGITATTYRGGFNVPVGSRLDFELQGVYYRYSDDNSRYSILPALYYRFRPTNPSLRVGLGYTYDDTDKLRNIYYTPQNYSAFAALADYSNTIGKTRYGFNAAVPLTNSTGSGGINRPADTLFGFVSRDVGNSLEIFANGGIVRSPDFKSDQITFGGNYSF